jgi:MMP 1-O-methyltransferase
MDPAAQREAVGSVEALPGWLLDGDALKLYELAHAAQGPILEIGTYRGKSAILMATALRDAGSDVPLVSLDVDREGLEAARSQAEARGLAGRIAFARGTAEALFRTRPDFTPSLVFLDGDHSRRGVARDLRALRGRVPSGGLLLFHDFHDERNADPGEPDYGVTEAVEESWVARDCAFDGIFGCCALYRRETGGPSAAGGHGTGVGEIADLGREPVASWLERRVVGRIARRAGALRGRGGA